MGNEVSKDTIKLEGVLSEGYGFSPKKVMRDQRLSIEGKGLYAYFASFVGAGESAFPSVSTICKDLKISEKRFRKHRKDLEKCEYINVSQIRGKTGFSHNIYTIKHFVSGQNVPTQNVSSQNVSGQNDTSNSNSFKSNSSNNNKENKDSVELENSQIPFAKIIDYLNQETNKGFRNVETNKKLIRARWNEGYRLTDFQIVVDNMVANWNGIIFSDGTPAEKFLQPATLFGTGFDKYLNQVPINHQKKETDYSIPDSMQKTTEEVVMYSDDDLPF